MLGNLVETIKTKVNNALLKNKKEKKKGKGSYMKMDKSASVKVEIRRRKAPKIIDNTMKLSC